MKRVLHITKLALLALAVAAIIVAPAFAATSGSTVISTTDGDGISIVVSPAALSLATDVVDPGVDWTYLRADDFRAWFPGSWLGGAWEYTSTGTAACGTVEVVSYLSAWTLKVFRTISPTQPLQVAIASTYAYGAGCTEPTDSLHTTSVTADSVGTAQTWETSATGGDLTLYWTLALHPTAAITGNPTVTLTFVTQP